MDSSTKPDAKHLCHTSGDRSVHFFRAPQVESKTVWVVVCVTFYGGEDSLCRPRFVWFFCCCLACRRPQGLHTLQLCHYISKTNSIWSCKIKSTYDTNPSGPLLHGLFDFSLSSPHIMQYSLCSLLLPLPWNETCNWSIWKDIHAANLICLNAFFFLPFDFYMQTGSRRKQLCEGIVNVRSQSVAFCDTFFRCIRPFNHLCSKSGQVETLLPYFLWNINLNKCTNQPTKVPQLHLLLLPSLWWLLLKLVPTGMWELGYKNSFYHIAMFHM